MAETALLEVVDLVSGYGLTEVIHGLTLQARSGQVTAMLGANGAGKTTLMKALAGILPVTGGRIFLSGEDITAARSNRRVAEGMVLVPEGRMVFPGLNVRDNLRLGAINPRARSAWRASLDHVYHVFPRLLEREGQGAATLSGGEQQMLAIGRGLMARPKLMLLDEPTLGLAPTMSLQIFSLLRRLNEGGLSLLLAEQDVARTLALASHAFVIENGKVAVEGAARALSEDVRIKQAYLGL